MPDSNVIHDPAAIVAAAKAEVEASPDHAERGVYGASFSDVVAESKLILQKLDQYGPGLVALLSPTLPPGTGAAAAVILNVVHALVASTA